MQTFNSYTAFSMAFAARMVHGCGCGKKTIRTTGGAANQVIQTPGQNATKVQTAQVYQSATLARAPTGPVTNTRRTV